MKNLKYLDYRLVDDESTKIAREKYIDSIIAQEEEEKVTLAKKEALRKQAELDMLHDVIPFNFFLFNPCKYSQIIIYIAIQF